MTLLEECVEALEPKVRILPRNKSNIYSRLITDNFPIQINGSIDWEKVEKNTKIQNYSDIQHYLKKILGQFDEDVFVFWAEASLPLLQTNLSMVLKNIDDVLTVDFDTWIISPKHKFVIEFYHEGDITIGFWEEN